MAKKRLDVLLFEKGLCPSRERAKTAIMEGIVYIAGQKAGKAGDMVDENAELEVRGNDNAFVSRGGKKIEKAVRRLRDPKLSVVVNEGVDSKMHGDKVTEFTQSLRDKFQAGTIDRLDVVYMKYHSMSRQILTEETLFPVAEETLAGEASGTADNQLYIFEPDANSIFNEVLPMFVLSTMQEITIENRSSEQAARVMAMQSANDNAKKLLEELQLEYNKLRQQSITTELLDILGGQVER